MAERRMFAKAIVLSDAFLDMPMSARCLYFTLSMLADDDGFVGSPKAIMRQCGASQDDMAVLLQKRFVLGFDTGVIVIKHWRINNYLRNDRYQSTTYIEELSTLILDDKKAYKEADSVVGIPNSGKRYTQYSEDKDSEDKDSEEESKGKKFIPPTLAEVEAYCKERNSSVDPKHFYEYFTAGNWIDSKGNKVRNWKQKLITWEGKSARDNKRPAQSKAAGNISYDN